MNEEAVELLLSEDTDIGGNGGLLSSRGSGGCARRGRTSRKPGGMCSLLNLVHFEIIVLIVVASRSQNEIG